ncbi:MAG TPA: hypothetical protein V6C52_12075 [Coleofasciculaceae cyanobacterium]|jgi:hypothetical protein
MAFPMSGFQPNPSALGTGGFAPQTSFPGSFSSGGFPSGGQLAPMSAFGGGGVPQFNTGTINGFTPQLSNSLTGNLNNTTANFMPQWLNNTTNNATNNSLSNFMPLSLDNRSSQNILQPQYNMPQLAGPNMFMRAQDSGNAFNSTANNMTVNNNYFGPLITGNQGPVNSTFSPMLGFGAQQQQADAAQQQQTILMQQQQQQAIVIQQQQQQAAAQQQQAIVMQQQQQAIAMQQQQGLGMQPGFQPNFLPPQGPPQQDLGLQQTLTDMVQGMMSMMMSVLPMMMGQFRGGGDDGGAIADGPAGGRINPLARMMTRFNTQG